MGTTEEENRYKQQQEQAATQARLDFIRKQEEMAERQRQQEEADRKAAEDKLVNGTGSGQSNMTADAPATVGWPDNEVQAPPSMKDKVAGVLRGEAGDAALAAKLLNSGQAPLGSASAPAASADGAKDPAAGARAVKPALGLG